VRNSLGTAPIPTTLVAHESDHFLGTVSVIACDEESRPQYTPWIAALWVEPECRERGFGKALLEEALKLARRESFTRVFLHSGERRLAFYEKRGWTIRESDVPTAGMHILVRDGD
jgi:GNAT superfamily N-acetyltransferase